MHVAICGAGFSGLGAAIRLKQAGHTDFVVLERAPEVGGVWRDNVYPGCACDVESQLYSYSFAPNPEWSRAYSAQPEIRDYLRDCVARFELEPHLRCGHVISALTWEHAEQRWRIETSAGCYTADAVVAAFGALSEPRLPEVPGLDQFRGELFHSARWNTDYELRGRRVAVIGTGASAIQLVPAIQPLVSRLVLLQRTPPWVMPRGDRPFGVAHRAWRRRSALARRWERGLIRLRRELFVLLFRHARLGRIAERLARRHLARAVPDARLRAKLTPSYRFGCKRVLVSDDYLPAIQQPNVEVIASELVEVRAHSVVGADGSEREVDAIVFGTGFHVSDMPFARLVRGREGRSLEEVWAGSPRAHAGTMVAGFPNLFIIPGPNTGLGHTSVLLMAEAQIEHFLGALRVLGERDIAAVEPRPAAQAAYVARVDAELLRTVWNTGGCDSWYLDRTGRNSTLWPGSTYSYIRRVQRFRRQDHHLEARREPGTEVEGAR